MLFKLRLVHTEPSEAEKFQIDTIARVKSLEAHAKTTEDKITSLISIIKSQQSQMNIQY